MFIRIQDDTNDTASNSCVGCWCAIVDYFNLCFTYSWQRTDSDEEVEVRLCPWSIAYHHVGSFPPLPSLICQRDDPIACVNQNIRRSLLF